MGSRVRPCQRRKRVWGVLQIYMCISGVSKRHVLAYMEQWSREIIKELKHRVAKHHGNTCISQSEVMLV